MRFVAVELDHQMPAPVLDVAVSAAFLVVDLGQVARADRKSVRCLDPASILALQGRRHAGFDVGEHVTDQCAPRLHGAAAQRRRDPCRGGQPPLSCPQDQSDGVRFRPSDARVQQRLLDSDAWRRRRRMDRGFRPVEDAPAVRPHSVERVDATGLRNRHVHRIRRLIEHTEQPQRGRAASNGVLAGVQQSGPDSLGRIEGASEGGVDAGVDPLPSTVRDVGAGL